MKIPFRFPINRQQARENALYCAKKRREDLGQFWLAVAHTFPETAVDLTDEEKEMVRVFREQQLTTVTPAFMAEAMEAISFKKSTERRRRSGEMHEITNELYSVLRAAAINSLNPKDDYAIITGDELAAIKRAGWGIRIEPIQDHPDAAWRIGLTKP